MTTGLRANNCGRTFVVSPDCRNTCNSLLPVVSVDMGCLRDPHETGDFISD